MAWVRRQVGSLLQAISQTCSTIGVKVLTDELS
jgi:hypothetical protein